jgi:hypothetical protein
MSNPTWSNVPHSWGLKIFGDYMYVPDYDAGTISQIRMTDGVVVDSSWATGVTNPDGITIDNTGTYMYVTYGSNNTIRQIRMSDGVIVNATWVSGLTNPSDLAIDDTGTYMYVLNTNIGTVSKIQILPDYSSSIINASWASGVGSSLLGLAIDNTSTYMYVANFVTTNIVKINMSDGSIVDSSWATGLSSVYSLAIDNTNTFIYASYNSNIAKLQISDGLLVDNIATNGVYITIKDNYIYNQNYDTGNIGKYYIGPPPCFKEGTKILTDTGYKPIETLRKGDLVKTLKHGFVPINMIGKRDIYNPAQKERIKDQLYKCSSDKYPEIFEDLIITGCHSILVGKFTSKEQREKVIEVNGDAYVTDKKYRLPACADERAYVYEKKGNFTIYHIALENSDYYANYGVYANGLLVETCSKRYLKELSNMELIHF